MLTIINHLDEAECFELLVQEPISLRKERFFKSMRIRAPLIKLLKLNIHLFSKDVGLLLPPPPQ
jgi:hypothetical protein